MKNKNIPCVCDKKESFCLPPIKFQPSMIAVVMSMSHHSTLYRFCFLYLLFLSFLLGQRVHAGGHNTATHLHVSYSTRRERELAPKVIVGYASECNDQVMTAVQQGVNVVIWAFYHLSPGADDTSIQNTIDLDCIQHTIHTLDQKGFTDTVHLVSMGGWNGPHLDPYFQTASQWYQAWKALVGNLFHGIDIDFEGNDNRQSSWNYFTLEEMDRMGEIIQLAKDDGYIITIAPAQSYLDIHSSHFSRYVNLTDPSRSWHADFPYFGMNVYAYWLAKYGDLIDLVMVQFYESFSRAAMEITQNNKLTPENYLQQYVWDLNQPTEGPGWKVDFGKDVPTSSGSSRNETEGLRHVALPISKLVWGFANAWANTDNGGRHLYFPPITVQAAYQNLWDWMLEPRGMMFWNIANEGEQGIYYARGLNQILHIRNSEEQPLHDIDLKETMKQSIL